MDARISRKVLADTWGDENLVTVSETDTRPCALPRESQEILVSTGIPKEAQPFFVASPQPEAVAAGKMCKIGSDGETDICVEAGSGYVWSISTNQDLPNRFVNSGLQYFLVFLQAVTVVRRTIVGMPDEAIDARLDILERELRSIDSRALSEPDHWWAVIIEQLRDGLL